MMNAVSICDAKKIRFTKSAKFSENSGEFLPPGHQVTNRLRRIHQSGMKLTKQLLPKEISIE
jgi:hypothetical protein